MFNRVIFIGNLTKDPELRYSPQGTPICTFRLAVNSRFKQAAESKEEVLFIDIVVFGKQAEPCSQYLAKGRPALVEGRLRERRWEADGQQKSKMEVLAQSVRFLGGRDQAPGGQAGGGEFGPPPEETMDEPF
ncbi:MAG: single-stranded DNA-binding protein [Actinomycetota bacterium]|nr:single-stranded DNA-binding protein [Actinomycetota bacterium]MDA8173879.1 single-stranded DNA-binding protein [Nitrospiraceae bacterium]